MKQKNNKRIQNFIVTNYKILNTKILVFKTSFSIGLFSIFFGFIFGNIFGTFLYFLRHYILWDGLLIFLLLFCFELFNYLYYRKKKLSFLKNLNFFKIGLLFGFFVDAFKVGS
jgi:hypothetical protein